MMLSERLSRPAGDSLSQDRELSAQIIENLVGREIEVMLTRSVLQRETGADAGRVEQVIFVSNLSSN
jgi:hypothetical protein